MSENNHDVSRTVDLVKICQIVQKFDRSEKGELATDYLISVEALSIAARLRGLKRYSTGVLRSGSCHRKEVALESLRVTRLPLSRPLPGSLPRPSRQRPAWARSANEEGLLRDCQVGRG